MMRRIAVLPLSCIVSGTFGAMVAWVVCSTMLGVPWVAGYAPAEVVTIACGVVTVVVAACAPLDGARHD